jgi:phage baseplate assembly protein W
MAIAVRKIFKNDLRPRVAIGFDLPINGEAVFNQNFLTKDAIKNNLINYFLTNPGERVSNPTFGAGLRQYVFTQIETGNLDFIKEDIQQKISNNFTNIIVESINILQQPEYNTIIVQIKYSIRDTGINDELELTFA